MLVLRFLLSALLALSGITDTGKFLEEAAKTFKTFEKSGSGKLNASSSKETQKSGVKSESENSNVESLDNAKLSENVDTVAVEKVSISEKIDKVSEGYKKVVLNPLSIPTQMQKLLYATVKPISEFFGAGYIMCGYENKNGPFNWFDVLSGKPNKNLLDLH